MSPCSRSYHRALRHPGQLSPRAAGRTRRRRGARRHFDSALRRLCHHHLEAAREQRGSHLQGNAQTQDNMTLGLLHPRRHRVSFTRAMLTFLCPPQGPSASLVAPVQCFCQHLPHDAAGHEYMDPLLRLDGYR